MTFSPQQVTEIESGYAAASRSLCQMRLDLTYTLGAALSNQRAREYLLHGVCRRLRTIERCLVNVFRIFPVGRTSKLSWDELADVEINLHAFFINIHGLLDNIAWVCVLEKPPDGGINRSSVDLFKSQSKIQTCLPEQLRKHLQTPETVAWHKEYSKNYRDALAHRIPLYIPPSAMTPEEQERDLDIDREISCAISEKNLDAMDRLDAERESLGRICPIFMHSFFDSDKPRPLRLHPQMIADSNTIMKIIKTFMDAVLDARAAP